MPGSKRISDAFWYQTSRYREFMNSIRTIKNNTEESTALDTLCDATAAGSRLRNILPRL